MEEYFNISYYIMYDLGKLWSVLTAAIKVEMNKTIDLEKFPDAQKNKDCIIAEVEEQKGKVETTSKAQFRMLATIRTV